MLTYVVQLLGLNLGAESLAWGNSRDSLSRLEYLAPSVYLATNVCLGKDQRLHMFAHPNSSIPAGHHHITFVGNWVSASNFPFISVLLFRSPAVFVLFCTCLVRHAYVAVPMLTCHRFHVSYLHTADLYLQGPRQRIGGNAESSAQVQVHRSQLPPSLSEPPNETDTEEWTYILPPAYVTPMGVGTHFTHFLGDVILPLWHVMAVLHDTRVRERVVWLLDWPPSDPPSSGLSSASSSSEPEPEQ
eukprot:2537272-Rhodomonas_salina.3